MFCLVLSSIIAVSSASVVPVILKDENNGILYNNLNKFDDLIILENNLNQRIKECKFNLEFHQEYLNCFELHEENSGKCKHCTRIGGAGVQELNPPKTGMIKLERHRIWACKKYLKSLNNKKFWILFDDSILKSAGWP